MSAVERLDDDGGGTPDPLLGPAATGEAVAEPAKRRARLRLLLALSPHVARYRGPAILALIALTFPAITTLVVQIAVRRLVNFGLTPKGIELIN